MKILSVKVNLSFIVNWKINFKAVLLLHNISKCVCLMLSVIFSNFQKKSERNFQETVNYDDDSDTGKLQS